MATKMQSVFGAAPHIPADAIFALTAQYLRDTFPKKVNLGQGAYRDSHGQPFILPSVALSRQKLAEEGLQHEYLPILGLPEFRAAASELVLGKEGYVSKRLNVRSLYHGTKRER